MIKLSIPIPELKAVALFASRDAMRYVLNCVCLRLRAKGHPVNLYATDGRRLAALKSTAEIVEGEQPQEDYNVLIPLPLIALAKPWEKKSKKTLLWIESIDTPNMPNVIGPKRYRVTFDDTIQQVSRKSVDGNYPSLIGTFPREPMAYAATQLCLNGRFVGDLYEAGKILRPKECAAVKLATAGKDSVIFGRIVGVPDFYCMIMPVRGNHTEGDSPELFNTPSWIDMTTPGAPVTTTGKPLTTP